MEKIAYRRIVSFANLIADATHVSFLKTPWSMLDFKNVIQDLRRKICLGELHRRDVAWLW